ncbi:MULTISPECIES: HepT-like ribonuclease domain-containing protein [unclassified Neomoorella]|uniref:HepT-like ribonuclease domain-containing protein n=1 Tax=unclassified Neomoorella TaxID=2676739 RepID=UPI0035A5EF9A
MIGCRSIGLTSRFFLDYYCIISGRWQSVIFPEHLRRALEALLDIGRHIIAKKGLGRPEDYKSIIILLGKKRCDPHGIYAKVPRHGCLS